MGSVGRSELFGGAGDDRLSVIGGDENRLADGLGKDWMIGGDGKDNFVLTASDNALDTIGDFSGGSGDQDKIDLSAFGAGATNQVSPAAFSRSTASRSPNSSATSTRRRT